MTEELNLYQKIADVKANIDGFTKDTKGYNFSYVSGSQILHRIRTKMIEHNLLLVPNTTNEQWTTLSYKNKKGHEVIDFVVEMDLNYKWINADKPEEQLDISYHAFGQQSDISQAHGTALTYAERYFLMKFFNIPTDEDDADAREKQDKYSKVDPKNIKTLEDEIEMFSQLMQSNGKDVPPDKVKAQLNIKDVNQLSNNQIATMISTLDKWSKQAKESK
jgi:hypothetical protein